MQPYQSPVGRYAFGSIKTTQQTQDGKNEWLAALVFDVPECKPLFESIDEEIQERQNRKEFPINPPKDAKMPFKPSMQKTDDGSKVAEEGKLLWVFRKKELRMHRGEQVIASAPQIWDGGGLNITKNCPDIGYGSMLKVFYTPYAYTKFGVGVTLQLLGVQIVELNERVDDFTPDAVEGAYRAPEEMQPGKSLAEMFEGNTFEPD